MPQLSILERLQVRRDTREQRSEIMLEQFVAANATAGGAPLRLLILVAHPDDEAIGAGALLGHYPLAVVAHLTDGGGVEDTTAIARGFTSRAAYAAARRGEVLAGCRSSAFRRTAYGRSAFPITRRPAGWWKAAG